MCWGCSTNVHAYIYETESRPPVLLNAWRAHTIAVGKRYIERRRRRRPRNCFNHTEKTATTKTSIQHSKSKLTLLRNWQILIISLVQTPKITTERQNIDFGALAKLQSAFQCQNNGKVLITSIIT